MLKIKNVEIVFWLALFRIKLTPADSNLWKRWPSNKKKLVTSMPIINSSP